MKYARAGDVAIAYQLVGEGPPDVVLVSTWFSHVEARWDIPSFAHLLRRLASFSRLISFDKRGIGLSDPVSLDRLPLLEEWMTDVRTVINAVGVERAVVMGSGEGSMMAALFAATHPERVSALVLANATARPAWAPDNPSGVPPDVVDQIVESVDRSWGDGMTVAATNPTVADDDHALREWGRFLRLSASPSVAAAVIRMLFELDVRAVLPTIRVPTLVVSRRDALFSAESGRAVASLIPGAEFVEVPGVDYGLGIGDVDPLIDEVEAFVTGTRPTHDVDRVLATVLFTDIVGSTKRATELGDRRWTELLAEHHEVVQAELDRHGGRVVRIEGDGTLSTFDGPARAVRCATAIRQALSPLGVEIRAGLHTGEVELAETGVEGIAVHIGARVAALAGPGEVLVSRTVKDLVAGSGLEFQDRGMHELKGVPDTWQIFQAES